MASAFACGGDLLALALPINAAAAADSIQVQTATLVAKGAEVDVTVTFTCPAGDVVQAGNGVGVSVQEAVGKALASGFGSVGGVTCTGSPQTVVVQVLAAVTGPPFKNGVAVANAGFFECDLTTFNCSGANSGSTTVRITK